MRTGGPEARRPSLLDETDAALVAEPVSSEQTLQRARRQRVRRIGAVTLGAAAVIVLVVGLAAGLIRPSVELFTPAGDPADALWGRTFFSVSAIEDGRPRPLAPDTRIRLSFGSDDDIEGDIDALRESYESLESDLAWEDGNGYMSWDAGCNNHSRRVAITTEGIRTGPGLSTAAGCHHSEQEAWVSRFLHHSEPAWELEGDRLVLTSGDDVIVLTEDGEPLTSPAEDLWGRTFFSVSAIAAGRPRPLAPGTRIRLSFTRDEDIEGDLDALRETYELLGNDLAWEDGDGYISWDAGCNHANARVAITTEEVRTSRNLSTGAGCGEVSQQESWVSGSLASEPAWELEGDRLVLTSGDDVIVLTEDAPAPGSR